MNFLPSAITVCCIQLNFKSKCRMGLTDLMCTDQEPSTCKICLYSEEYYVFLKNGKINQILDQLLFIKHRFLIPNSYLLSIISYLQNHSHPMECTPSIRLCFNTQDHVWFAGSHRPSHLIDYHTICFKNLIHLCSQFTLFTPEAHI